MSQFEKADLGSDYKNAGFGGALAFGKRPAQLIVDFVRAYIEPGSPLYANCESAFESAKRDECLVRKRQQVAELTDRPHRVLGLPAPIVPLRIRHVGPLGVPMAATRRFVVVEPVESESGGKRREWRIGLEHNPTSSGQR